MGTAIRGFVSAVQHESLAGHVARATRGEECDRFRDFARASESLQRGVSLRRGDPRFVEIAARYEPWEEPGVGLASATTFARMPNRPSSSRCRARALRPRPSARREDVSCRIALEARRAHVDERSRLRPGEKAESLRARRGRSRHVRVEDALPFVDAELADERLTDVGACRAHDRVDPAVGLGRLGEERSDVVRIVERNAVSARTAAITRTASAAFVAASSLPR